MAREDELKEQGWTRRNTYDEPRLSELTRMYMDMGQEVHLEPFSPATADGCEECMRLQPERYKTIYTRPGKGIVEGGDLEYLY